MKRVKEWFKYHEKDLIALVVVTIIALFGLALALFWVG